MRKITLVLGGVRSGKSLYVLSLAEADGDEVVYVVSATVSDAEMDRRIERHRRERPAGWTVIEAGNDTVGALRKADGKSSLIIIDCLTMLIGSCLDESVMTGETIDEHNEEAAYRRAQDIVE
ncbi:MAG: bifunctional adenosylcobinamide kinase/adenosylcobinamide-phosphate guanylyltransferase, partial [Actinomycetota bacterium]